MASAVANPVKPHRTRTWILVSAIVRTAIFTITCTGLGMAFGLFTGIVVQVIRSFMHHGVIDMTVAYRDFGIPLAALCGVAALVVFIVIEKRTARRLLAEARG